jgi:hypothetical protein
MSLVRGERGEAGVFIGGFWLALGPRVCEMEADRTAVVTGVSGEDSSRTTRCLTGRAHLLGARRRRSVPLWARPISGMGLSGG